MNRYLKPFLALLGVFAMGEGLTLILIPRDYLGFWAGNASVLIARVKPGPLARPQILRLLGLLELSLGLGCVAMRLAGRAKPEIPVEQEILLPATRVAKEVV